MRKSIKLFSVTVMAILMSLCFIFAGSALTKAEAPSSLVVLDGASVYVSNNANESGIKFDVEILKTDYQKLVEDNAGSDIYLGVEVIRATSGEVLGSYDVNTTGALKTSEENSSNYAYSFAIIYNEISYIDGLIKDSKIEDTEEAKANAINKMYTDELAVKPFYKVVPAEGEAVVEYGVVGDSRSMLHVANAEVVAGSDLPANFASTYIAEQIAGGEVEVDALGAITGDISAEIKTFTMGDSAEVVAREDAVIGAEYLAGLNVDDQFALYGFTADRKVYSYNATYIGEEVGVNRYTEKVLVDRATGKIFFNETSTPDYVATVDTSLIPATQKSNEKTTVEASIGGENYKFINAWIYDGIFENTHESRVRFIETFTWASKTITGYYVLAENIKFDHFTGANGAFDLSETFAVNSQNKLANVNIFMATLDGRGYALQDVGVYRSNTGIFGNIGEGATIKNLAIKNVWTNYTAAQNLQLGHLNSVLFNTYTSATVKFTLENVYIENYVNIDYSGTGRYNSVIMYNNLSGDANTAGETMLGAGTFTNVIINSTAVDADGNIVGTFDENGVLTSTGTAKIAVVSNTNWGNSASTYKGFGDDCHINNSYIITNGRWTKGLFGSYYQNPARQNSRGETFGSFTSYQDFVNNKAEIAVDTFSSDYWVINADGVPVWKSTLEIPQILDAEGNEVDEINYTVSGATDSLFFTAGIWTPYGIKNAVVSTDNADNIIINGNSIEIKPGKYTATITVANLAGTEEKTVNVSVDNSAAGMYTEKVLVDRATGKIFFNETSTPDLVATIDTSLIPDTQKSNEQTTIEAYIGEEKYTFINAWIYDAIFENTHESRVRFIETFTWASKTISGYYILAENIKFDHFTGADGAFDLSETFTVNKSANVDLINTFVATLDGRGYAIEDLGVVVHHCGIFGNVGEGAAIKNLAIKNVLTNTSEEDNAKHGNVFSLLFYTYTSATAKFTLENVYIENNILYGYSASGHYNSILLRYNPDGEENANGDNPIVSGTFTNVIINTMQVDADGNPVGTFNEDGDITAVASSSDLKALTQTQWTNKRIGDDCHINNSYVITNGTLIGGLTGNWYEGYAVRKNSRGECFMAYGSYQNFVNNKDDVAVETFSSDYWVINTDGVPVWKSLQPVA